MYLGTGKNMSINWFLPLQEETRTGASEVSEIVSDSATRIVISEGTAPVSEEVSPNSAIIDESTATPSNVKEKLIDALTQLKTKLVDRIDCDLAGYDKAVETFAKTVNKLPSKSDSSLQKALHTFGKSVTQVL